MKFISCSVLKKINSIINHTQQFSMPNHRRRRRRWRRRFRHRYPNYYGTYGYSGYPYPPHPIAAPPPNPTVCCCPDDNNNVQPPDQPCSCSNGFHANLHPTPRAGGCLKHLNNQNFSNSRAGMMERVCGSQTTNSVSRYTRETCMGSQGQVILRASGECSPISDVNSSATF